VRRGRGHGKVGEIVIDARTAIVQRSRSSATDVIRARLADRTPPPRTRRAARDVAAPPGVGNTILCGDSEQTLVELPAESVQLVFTSPPYYNARPDYTDYVTYEEYLLKMRKVIRQVHRVLEEGRFFVMNVAPVLLRRASRAQASRRIAVPFDMHRLFVEEGFEFIDDIVWEKPEGAGWATGRGRRFAADRNPLQYKAVPVTEYVLVYRKASDRLIDWHIRNHHDPGAVRRSRIDDGYARTNVWRISPASSRLHPAVFPLELAERVVRYYSFEGDVVLDPFAGIGTVGEAAARLGRRFVLAEQDPAYVDVIRDSAGTWPGVGVGGNVRCSGCPPLGTERASVPAPSIRTTH
jgi:DNA modification methylase